MESLRVVFTQRVMTTTKTSSQMIGVMVLLTVSMIMIPSLINSSSRSSAMSLVNRPATMVSSPNIALSNSAHLVKKLPAILVAARRSAMVAVVEAKLIDLQPPKALTITILDLMVGSRIR